MEDCWLGDKILIDKVGVWRKAAIMIYYGVEDQDWLGSYLNWCYYTILLFFRYYVESRLIKDITIR